MNKFEKHYYQYWKTTIDLMKCKIIIIILNLKKLLLLLKKKHNFLWKIKKIKNLTDKLNIIINILNIIVGFGVAARRNVLGFAVAAKHNTFGSYIFKISFY